MTPSASLPDLPDLQIVPTSALQPHEQADESRARPLMERLRMEGVLRNPPVVIPAGDRSERFVVLDGANRTLAMRLMGLPHVLVQVVHAGGMSVELETWNHVVSAIEPEALLAAIERHPELAFVSSDLDRAAFNLSAGGTLAYLVIRGGRVLEVVGETEPLGWGVRNLSRLVSSYLGLARVDRVRATDVRALEPLYPAMTVLVVFRRFEIEEVVQAATSGLLLPGGLTRFIVSPRALRLNYPLEHLAGDASLEEKRRVLAEWVRERVSGRHIRYYGETTFLFDE